jgi:Flp pilus assembly protein TadB
VLTHLPGAARQEHRALILMSAAAKLLFLLVTLLHLLPVLFLTAVIVGITLPVILIRAN